MEQWKKDFEEIHNLKANFAPNEPEQKMFKSGYDNGVESQIQELEKLRKGIKSICKECNPYDSPQVIIKMRLKELLTQKSGDTNSEQPPL